MDEEIRSQLNALAQKQADMQEKLRQMGEESRSIDADLRRLLKRAEEDAAPAAKDLEKLTDAIADQQPKTEDATPPPLPSKFTSALGKATPPERKAEKKVMSPPPESTPQPVAKKSQEPQKPATPPSSKTGEWEINFGQVWLVRIGILLLLTGLIFLSTYAYKNWLFSAGAGAKVAFFMTVSLTLTGLGMWLEKKRERFQQYGRVLAAGGLAAGYYTIYAAHFTPSLKLIDSPIFTGILLTLWAGGMLAYAVWKQSRVVAVMAIGLAFYGTVVNPAGWLSLFSALLLSSAGIWLMMKFRWMMIGLGTMLAAYVSHAFWLGGAYPQSADEAVRFTYLACYWLLFTAALAMPQTKLMPGKIQRVFCAANNIAAWQLAVFLIPDFTPHAQTGWISIGVGALWLGLAAIAHRGKLWDKSLVPIFAYQGILVISFGILLEATGYTRFLLLAVEACLLMARAQDSTSKLLRWISGGVFICALIVATPPLSGVELAAWQGYAALALVCAGYTALLHLDTRRALAIWGNNAEASRLIPVLSALATWLVLGYGVFDQWSASMGVNGLWVTSTAVTVIYFLTKKPYQLTEVALTSFIAALAGVIWFLIMKGNTPTTVSVIPLIGAATFWFLSPRITSAWDSLLTISKKENAPSSQVLEWLFSLSFWLILAITLHQELETPKGWLALGGVLALAGNAAGEYTRRRSIAVPALFFHFFAFAALSFYGTRAPVAEVSNLPALSLYKTYASVAGWMPALLLLIHLFLTDSLWSQLNRKTMRLLLALGLVATVGMHSFQEFARPDIALTMLGVGMMAWAYWRKDHAFAIVGAVLPLVIACLSAVAIHGQQDWLRHLPIIVTLALHALLWWKTKDNNHWKPTRIFLIGTGLLCLFVSASVHVTASFDGSGLAICWSLLATLLFTAGLILRCRPYRLIGLLWLAMAVLHVVFIDVMRLETLGRILSFITLGLVLLGLGFLYNRYQEIIRKFL